MGADPLSEESVERLRIEAGFPRWGIDCDSRHLPVEAGLDPLAVSFTKGCYLGQEVLLRLHNFGEAPERLVRIEFEGPDVPAAGTEVRSGGARIGRITSAALSSSSRNAVALAMLRKGYNGEGTAAKAGSNRGVIRPLPWHAWAERPPEASRA